MINLLQEIWSEFSEYLIITALAIGIILAMVFFIKFQFNLEDKFKQRSYTAWVKQTGNSKNLTFEEWKDFIAYNKFVDSK